MNRRSLVTDVQKVVADVWYVQDSEGIGTVCVMDNLGTMGGAVSLEVFEAFLLKSEYLQEDIDNGAFEGTLEPNTFYRCTLNIKYDPGDSSVGLWDFWYIDSVNGVIEKTFRQLSESMQESVSYYKEKMKK